MSRVQGLLRMPFHLLLVALWVLGCAFGRLEAAASFVSTSLQFSDRVDRDGDGCFTGTLSDGAFTLTWRVQNGGSSISGLYEKVFIRRLGQSQWEEAGELEPFGLGVLQTATRSVRIPVGSACNVWEYRVELWRNGQLYTVVRATGQQREETVAEDGGTAGSPPQIASQPASTTVIAGASASFSIGASGTPAPSYRWQRQAVGSSGWTDIGNSAGYAGAASQTLSVLQATLGMSGDLFRCIVSNPAGSVTSGTATLTVRTASVAPVITLQPTNQTVPVGAMVVFQVAATGSPTPAFRWQRLPAGQTGWQDLAEGFGYSGRGTPTLTIAAATREMSGDRFRCVIGNEAGGVTSSTVTLTVSLSGNAPTITQQPADARAVVGQSVSFRVEATGSPAPAFRWQRRAVGQNDWMDLSDGGAYSGRGTRVLTVGPVSLAMSGDQFRCIVGNELGGGPSSVATLTVGSVPGEGRTVVARAASGSPGSTVVVPIDLIASGDENTVAFTLKWDPQVLSLVSFQGGSALQGSSPILNTNQSGQGRVGVLVALSAGSAFRGGTNQIGLVTFACSASIQGQTSTEVSFGDELSFREVVSSQAQILEAAFLPGQVSISVGLEGDLVPRPGGDQRVSAADYTLLDMVVVGNLPATDLSDAEFVRADCAPLATRGDGRVTASDRVQAARFAVGLDPTLGAGGPGRGLGAGRVAGLQGGGAGAPSQVALRLEGVSNGVARVVAALTAVGAENAVAFSITFGSSSMRLRSAKAAELPAGGVAIFNTNGAGSGLIGVLVTLPPGQTFEIGQVMLARFEFEVDHNTPVPGTGEIGFGDTPVYREIVSLEAGVLPGEYVGISLSGGGAGAELVGIGLYPGFRIRGVAGRRYRVEWSSDPDGPTWLLLETVTLAADSELWIDRSGPAQESVRFYRAIEMP